MNKAFYPATLVAAIAAGLAASATNGSESGAALTDAMRETISTAVRAAGYEPVKFESEDGGREIEVYATKGGQLWELEVDPATGAILEAERED